jgi:hypothetical protein
MRYVYNGAYCTISATCAAGTLAGFLNYREPREFVAIEAKAPSGKDCRIYICKTIDDFQTDVGNADLSTRGWVYQERALSRRILHFAKNQVYMECGTGVCCETSTRMFK